MTLKQQIEATIQAYEEACKPENLNWSYCFIYDISLGMCHFLQRRNYNDLYLEINTIFKSKYMCISPFEVFFNKQNILDPFLFKDTNIYTLIETHQIRLQYLRNLLN
jgi:hypothetical protein